MIDLSQTLFILDGPSDIKSFEAKIQKEYQVNVDFRKAQTNGHTVSPQGYVNGIKGIIDLALNSSYRHIICILDREARQISAKALADKVSQHLLNHVQATHQLGEEEFKTKIRVVAADRMFENWIVADTEGIKKRDNIVKQDIVQNNFDGQSGVKILKSFLTTQYNKVKHAPHLFKAVEFDRAVNNSPSLKKLLTVIEVI